MQIKKIVSGAQTGADRAALDFAGEYGIDRGGWVPEGRIAEDGVVDSGYGVKELPGGGYVQRTEKNVEDSDGTLIVSRGELTGGSLLTRQMAEKHARPCLHVDMERLVVFDAAIDVYEWLKGHNIEVLNVAGPRASKDPGIYDLTWNLLEMVVHIDAISGAMPPEAEGADKSAGTADWENILPRSVEEAVDMLLAELSAKTRARIASRSDKELVDFEKVLARHIIDRFRMDSENTALLDSCRDISGRDSIDSPEAAMIIVRKLWERLREIGHLRVVK